MATTTPNFGWSVPTSTDLVKDGATAIETLGDAIDASMADLKGGTTGQVLKKNSGTDMDFVWSADSAGMTNPMTTTGDTIYSSSGSTPARLGIGSTGQVLTVSGGIPSWATPAGALTVSQIATGSLSGSSVSITGLSSYDYLFLQIDNVTLSANTSLLFTINNDTSAVYAQQLWYMQSNFATYNGKFNNSTPSNYIYAGYNSASQLSTNADNWRTLRLMNCKNAGYTDYFLEEGYKASGGTDASSEANGQILSAAAVSSIQIKTVSGQTFSTGTYTIYGG